MKRIIALVLAIGMIAAMLTGCGDKRELYNVKLEDYVSLAEYDSILVDRASEEYKQYYDYAFENYVYTFNAYAKQTTGTVKEGDTVNIDYVGKKDGVAFEGGTASGTDLTIGSNQFIEGFEAGLIGKEVGTTVDLNLTFPETYGAADLAGKAVVFTVKINYIRTMPTIDDDLADKLGFENDDALLAELDKRAIDNTIYVECIENSTVNKYSEKDKKIYDERYSENIAQITGEASSYGYDLETYLYYLGYGSSENYKASFYQQMEASMVFYAIFDAEELSYTEDDINETVNSISSDTFTVAQVRENYAEWELEALTVQNIVIEHLRENVITVK